jgi:hypothetical protein
MYSGTTACSSRGVERGLVMSAITKLDKPASRRTVSVKSLVLGLVEVEHHRDEVPFPEFIAQPLEDSEPAAGKAAKQQDTLLADGVDDVADLFVVEQQVDELGHLEVADSDLWLVFPSDDQVLLGCFLQV